MMPWDIYNWYKRDWWDLYRKLWFNSLGFFEILKKTLRFISLTFYRARFGKDFLSWLYKVAREAQSEQQSEQGTELNSHARALNLA